MIITYFYIKGIVHPKMLMLLFRLPSPLKTDFLFSDEFCMLANPQIITKCSLQILWTIHW